MGYRVAINGFGRIGRTFLRAAIGNYEIDIVAINDLADNDALSYLLKYDTAYGNFPGEVGVDKDSLFVDGVGIKMLAEPDPEKLPWEKLGVDIVVESTGAFTDPKKAQAHIKAGAKAVVISAPAKGEGAQTGILGVNTIKVSGSKKIFSNGSCTTNCVAPIMALLESGFGVDKAMMTTVHAYTSSQGMQDSPDAKDWRRGRAGAANIIPTSTGAAKVTGEVIPSIKNSFDGIALRVPIITGSISDITAVLKKKTTVKELNEYFTEKSDRGIFRGVLKVTEDPIVSSDVIGSTYSSIIDLAMTRVVGGNMVKIVSWYDNERGYVQRLLEQVVEVAKQIA